MCLYKRQTYAYYNIHKNIIMQGYNSFIHVWNDKKIKVEKENSKTAKTKVEKTTTKLQPIIFWFTNIINHFITLKC